MATISGTKALYTTQRQFERDYKQLLTPVARQISGLLIQYAGDDGTIDPRNEVAVRREAAVIVIDVFTRPVPNSPYPDGRAPFAANGFTAVSPYAALLNRALVSVQVAPVRANFEYIRRRLPADLLRRMQQGRVVRELVTNFTSNPLALYESAHTWVDPRGWRLSDRIWNVGDDTRKAIDRLLSEGIRQGRSALALSRELEQFLIPGRAQLRTRRPYGSDASFYGMRLARTEIARAHAQATRVASLANPFVAGMDFALSPSHPRRDICDGFATIGMGGERLKPAYPVEQCPMPVESTHPNCLCNVRPYVNENVREVIDQLRAAFEAGDVPYVNPSSPFRFLEALLGAVLMQIVMQEFGEWLQEAAA